MEPRGTLSAESDAIAARPPFPRLITDLPGVLFPSDMDTPGAARKLAYDLGDVSPKISKDASNSMPANLLPTPVIAIQIPFETTPKHAALDPSNIARTISESTTNTTNVSYNVTTQIGPVVTPAVTKQQIPFLRALGETEESKNNLWTTDDAYFGLAHTPPPATSPTTRFNNLVHASNLTSIPESHGTSKHFSPSFSRFIHIITATLGILCIFYRIAACGFQMTTTYATLENSNIDQKIIFILGMLNTSSSGFITLVNQAFELWFLFNSSREYKENERTEWQNALGGTLTRRMIKLIFINFLLVDTWLLFGISGRIGMMTLAQNPFQLSPWNSDLTSWPSLMACQFSLLPFSKKVLTSIDRFLAIQHNGFQLKDAERKEAVLGDFIHALKAAKGSATQYANYYAFEIEYLRKVSYYILDLPKIEQYQQLNSAFREHLKKGLLQLGVQEDLYPIDGKELYHFYMQQVELQFVIALNAAKKITETTDSHSELAAVFAALLANEHSRITLPLLTIQHSRMKHTFAQQVATANAEQYYLTHLHISSDASHVNKLKRDGYLLLLGGLGLALSLGYTIYNSFALSASMHNTVDNYISLPIVSISTLSCFWIMGLHDIFKGTLSSPTVNRQLLERSVGILACALITLYQTLLMSNSANLMQGTLLSHVRIVTAFLASLGTFAMVNPFQMMDLTKHNHNQKRSWLPDFYSLQRGERLIAFIFWLSIIVNAIAGITLIGAFDKATNQISNTPYAAALSIGALLWMVIGVMTLNIGSKQALEYTKKFFNQLHLAACKLDNMLYYHCFPLALCTRVIGLLIKLFWKYVIEFILFDIPVWPLSRLCQTQTEQAPQTSTTKFQEPSHHTLSQPIDRYRFDNQLTAVDDIETLPFTAKTSLLTRTDTGRPAENEETGRSYSFNSAIALTYEARTSHNLATNP